jgi:hypothetical protein
MILLKVYHIPLQALLTACGFGKPTATFFVLSFITYILRSDDGGIGENYNAYSET